MVVPGSQRANVPKAARLPERGYGYDQTQVVTGALNSCNDFRERRSKPLCRISDVISLGIPRHEQYQGSQQTSGDADTILMHDDCVCSNHVRVGLYRTGSVQRLQSS